MIVEGTRFDEVKATNERVLLFNYNIYKYIYIFLHQILHIDIYTVIIVLQRRDYVAINVIRKIGVTNNYRIVHGHCLYSIIPFDEPTSFSRHGKN